MTTFARHLPNLEAALLRRSVRALSRACERCGRCRRSPLIGERVYIYESGATICELCRTLERSEPVRSAVVHGPAHGQSIRILDHRNAHARIA
jgi:predicted amidophosphoribosyltransferase